jgi:hypothetical protein
MEARIRTFRDHILGALDELESELHRTKADWEQKKGVFHEEGYVYRENLAIFAEELAAVQRTRGMIVEMDISRFTEIAEYRDWVIAELERAASASMLLRSGIALIIRLIRGMDGEATVRPFCT